MAVTSHFDLLKMRPKSAHSSSRFAISVSTVGDGPPKDMSSRYPKARGEVNLRRAGWSGRQNNKGPNGPPAVDRPLIELCICQILTETVPRKPGGSMVQSLAEECLWKTAYDILLLLLVVVVVNYEIWTVWCLLGT